MRRIVHQPDLDAATLTEAGVHPLDAAGAAEALGCSSADAARLIKLTRNGGSLRNIRAEAERLGLYVVFHVVPRENQAAYLAHIRDLLGEAVPNKS